MKKWVAFLLLNFFANGFAQTVAPQFSELNGIEDQQGNTHLFYRIYTSWIDSATYLPVSSNNIYHYDLSSNTDTLFLKSYYGIDSVTNMPEEFVISDLTFWQNNPELYIYGGTTDITVLYEHTFIYRFDSENTYYRRGVEHVIEISGQNDSLLYAGVQVYDSLGFELTIRSTDGGWNWESVSDTYELLSLNPFNDQTFFAWETIYKNLYKTTDGGISFYIVDSSMTYWEQQYHYDPDQTHIYRVVRNFNNNNYELKISSNDGEVFTWNTKYTSPNEIFISSDAASAGEIYLADVNNIYSSGNYGDDFYPVISLEDTIKGIYKKPNSFKLYAATKYRIYEIDIISNSLKVIKSITPPEENYGWLPLSISNLWVYENYYYENGIPEFIGYSWNIIDDEIVLSNGKKYFRMLQRRISGTIDTLFLRLDSLTAVIYAYDENSGEDLVYENLSGELGDTVCYEYNQAWGCQVVQSEEEFSLWGLNTYLKKLFPSSPGWGCDHSLVKGIGIYDYGCGDLIYFSSKLFGCIINGTVYGDTTVVSVEDEIPDLPTKFYLSQNYPNPFNPSTTIKFTIPNVERRASSLYSTTLKVYDVLGNEVATLVNKELLPGEYEVEFNAEGLPSGVYFYRLTAGSYSSTKKLLLLK